MAPTILLVEDDLICRRLINRILLGIGYNVICIDNAADALEELSVSKVDFLVTDYNLSGKETGRWLIDKIIKDLTLLDLPIILYSSSEVLDVQSLRNIRFFSKLKVDGYMLANFINNEMTNNFGYCSDDKYLVHSELRSSST